MTTTDPGEEQQQALLAACALGDKRAFTRLYKLCSPALYAILLRTLRHQQQAEEALQEVFVKIWNNAAAFRPHKGSPMAWMTSIARYRALDILRKTKRTPTEDRFSDLNIPSGEASPYENLRLDQQSGVLNECLEQLKEGMRNSLVMSYCEGYTHEELSRKLAAPIGTVKSWIRRGLQQLKRCMDEIS